MKKLTTLIITLMSLMVSVSLVAQMTVSGTVTDNESIPLIGVNILIKGQTTGTVSDIDGNYTLTANDGDVIVFSYTGYSSQEITIGNLTTIDIVMEEDAAFLDEVVVVGYSTQKKSNLTGAVASASPTRTPPDLP